MSIRRDSLPKNLQGINASLSKDEKNETSIPYNLYISHYGLLNSKQARWEANIVLDYRFP
jgi:hypothetical protein